MSKYGEGPCLLSASAFEAVCAAINLDARVLALYKGSPARKAQTCRSSAAELPQEGAGACSASKKL